MTVRGRIALSKGEEERKTLFKATVIRERGQTQSEFDSTERKIFKYWVRGRIQAICVW